MLKDAPPEELLAAVAVIARGDARPGTVKTHVARTCSRSSTCATACRP
jgi:hypothetical protein